MACSTFGRADRIRVPSPAANTMERQDLGFIYGFRRRVRTWAAYSPRRRCGKAKQRVHGAPSGSLSGRILLVFKYLIRRIKNGMARGDPPFEDDRRMDMRPLLRILAWGSGAVFAVAVAVFAGRSDIGERRVALALATMHNGGVDPARGAAAQLLAKANESEAEARRLAELSRALAADRDRLATRLTAVEQTLEDLTGSISLIQPARRPPGALWPAPPPSKAWEDAAAPADPSVRPAIAGEPATTPAPPAPAERAAEPAGEAAEIPLPRPNPGRLANAGAGDPAPADPAARPRSAVDLGGAPSVDGLRALWSRIRESQAPLVENLRPLVAVRDSAKPGSVELRLVAGPLANGAAAARLCASLSAVGIACRTAAYDGQRLAER
jgi:hypothetical protein